MWLLRLTSRHGQVSKLSDALSPDEIIGGYSSWTFGCGSKIDIQNGKPEVFSWFHFDPYPFKESLEASGWFESRPCS